MKTIFPWPCFRDIPIFWEPDTGFKLLALLPPFPTFFEWDTPWILYYAPQGGFFFFYLKHVWGRANCREGGLFDLEKMMVSILHKTLNVRAVKTSRDPCQSHNPYSKGGHSHIGSLSNDVFERRTSTGCGLFALFSRDFEQIRGQNVPLRVKTLTNTNLVALRYSLKKRKTRRSRASLKHAAGLNSLRVTRVKSN